MGGDFMGIKDKITEAAEKLYDIVHDDRYQVVVEKDGSKPTTVSVLTKRNTRHNIKWQAKNH
ncbi:hypothetical protein RU97_GL000303 [Enterococcus canis]|uniref:Uncharacterized protein n=2 Tax=Enterococcus canis TaxID=214095 RepID=A0A1L8RJX0_9ENTE|nr:hypothetical protein RU97_GL000303 [Enterococcus canis]